jgi:hypothetical protein
MLKSKSIWESQRGERLYQFNIDNDAPLGECFDVACEFRAFLFDRIATHLEKEKQDQEVKPVE